MMLAIIKLGKNMSKIVDERIAKSIVKKMFEEQQAEMSARALKPHEFDCDKDNCKKEVCWQWEPDKIVSEPYNE